MSALDREMAKLAAMGVTVSTRLAPGVPESARPATRIRDAARRAGIDEDDRLRAELDRIDALLLGAIRLGFQDDVRHWRGERTKVVQQMRDRGRGAQ